MTTYNELELRQKVTVENENKHGNETKQTVTTVTFNQKQIY